MFRRKKLEKTEIDVDIEEQGIVMRLGTQYTARE
jgi:hypothetical protein